MYRSFYKNRNIVLGLKYGVRGVDTFVQLSDGNKQKGNGWTDVVSSSLSKSEKLKLKMDFMRNRPIEEFYDLTEDPGCWDNLINDKSYHDKINEFRVHLKKEMWETNDPMRFDYQH
jgi:hypothetical protein